jgi:Ca-activated chloride channel homolog
MRASRRVLPAAALLGCAYLASATARAGDALTAWSDLWHTPDQQGQAMLDAGEPAQAAARFHDPRRRAYADLEAGRYRDAAKLLAPFTDAESEYNRGNALANSGQLEAALAAYNAALKQAPADKDIRHNRDLVERALRQRQQSARSSSQNGRQGSHSAGSAGQQPQAGGQRGGSGSGQSGAAGSRSAGGGQLASNGSRAGAGHAGNSGPQQPGADGVTPDAGGSQATGPSGSATSKEAPGQAQRDAAAAVALARMQRQRGQAANTGQAQSSGRSGASPSASKSAGHGPDSGDLLAGGTQTPKQKPETEKQLALDQWLRQIPDSPAGLLRRKFLIEYMMRRQESGEQEGSQ